MKACLLLQKLSKNYICRRFSGLRKGTLQPKNDETKALLVRLKEIAAKKEEEKKQLGCALETIAIFIAASILPGNFFRTNRRRVIPVSEKIRRYTFRIPQVGVQDNPIAHSD